MSARDKETIRDLLELGRRQDFLVLFDLLEERGWHHSLVDYTIKTLLPLIIDDGAVRGQPPSIAPTEVWVQLLSKLAVSDYDLAVARLNQVPLASRDYTSRRAFTQAVNDAHCPGEGHQNARKGTWEERLEHEKMEQVTGETGGDLGPWEVIAADGTPVRRQWTIDFAPEYMQREVEQEFGDGQFKTVWYGDGGNFGPSFDGQLRDKDGLWRQVRQFAAGHEPECPYLYGDDGNNVVLEHTYCGEYPGLKCRLCEADLGEEHGVIYLGELGAAVFMLDVMADVTDIEIQERLIPGGDGETDWRIVAFNSGEEVDISSLPDADGEFDTFEEANDVARGLPGTSAIRIHRVPLEEEND